MPTVLRIGGLRVVIYPNDHPPPHVHVIGAKGEAVLMLNCPNGPASLRETYGYNGREIRQMAADLLTHSSPMPRMEQYSWKSLTPRSSRPSTVCRSAFHPPRAPSPPVTTDASRASW